jgi:hypothetical protein
MSIFGEMEVLIRSYFLAELVSEINDPISNLQQNGNPFSIDELDASCI